MRQKWKRSWRLGLEHGAWYKRFHAAPGQVEPSTIVCASALRVRLAPVFSIEACGLDQACKTLL